MGKYDDFIYEEKDNSPQFLAWEIQRCIANELAEANRLKRLEIKLQTLKNEIISTPQNFENFSNDIERDGA